MSIKATELLAKHLLRATPIRARMVELFVSAKHAISQQQIEEAMGELDRITLYRTLKTFEQKGIIHTAFDGTSKTKYALCSHGVCNEHAHNDNHAHFHCLSCGQTECIEDISVPKIDMPTGFIVQSTQIVVQGLCSNCH
jgi:Fur family transcriptional regulator, ferric uptake regulator